MLSVVIEAFKKSIMFLCSPLANWCLAVQRLGFISLSTAHQPDYTGFTLCRFTWWAFVIHLITAVSVIKTLSLYEFTLCDRDLVSVVHIRESPYYRGFFKENIWEFCRDIETNCNREVSVLRSLTVLPTYLLVTGSNYHQLLVTTWLLVTTSDYHQLTVTTTKYYSNFW